MLYVRKYKKDAFDENFNDCKIEYMIQLINDLLDDLPDVFWDYMNRPENRDLKLSINE